jgi:threonine/homoserine/homoserine lactone efflux protein
VVFGLCTGIVVHTTLVAFGVAIIFKTSAVAFGLLKFVGAGYLAFLALQAFRASPRTIEGNTRGQHHLGKLYRRGIIMNVTNPKVSIFFLAFLPQFADPLRGPVSLQILYLGGLFIISTLLIFGAIALLAGTLGQWLKRSPRTQLILNKLAGSVFLALALKLVTASR